MWEALQRIPYGATSTYGRIAAHVGRPKACRAVGMANHRNPIAIVIPCHRVVGSDGTLTGYAGGLGVKERLLQLEQQERPHRPDAAIGSGGTRRAAELRPPYTKERNPTRGFRSFCKRGVAAGQRCS